MKEGLIEIFVIGERSIDTTSCQESSQCAGLCLPPPPPRFWILNVLVDATRHRGRTETADQNSGLVDLHLRKGKGRAANGNRPVGASCRREHNTMASCLPPPPPPEGPPGFRIVQTCEVHTC